MPTADLDHFIRSETIVVAVPLVPELRLHLARAPREIFQAAEERARSARCWPPYWAFAWPGGQALARFLLDHPTWVQGRTVVDVGAGSGLAAIAALEAGARSVTAIDPDPMACAAAEMNAALNGVVLAVHNADPLGGDIEADLVLVGDLVYEPELETRVTRFLDETRRRGTTILYADRTTARRPPLEMEHLAHWRAPLAPPLEDDHIEHARVWSIEARAPAPRPRLGGRGRP